MLRGAGGGSTGGSARDFGQLAVPTRCWVERMFMCCGGFAWTVREEYSHNSVNSKGEFSSMLAEEGFINPESEGGLFEKCPIVPAKRARRHTDLST